jgi:hypothetical protein
VRPPPESPYRLVVEGTDDLHSVCQLLMKFDYDWEDESRIRPFVREAGNDEKALAEFSLALKGS